MPIFLKNEFHRLEYEISTLFITLMYIFLNEFHNFEKLEFSQLFGCRFKIWQFFSVYFIVPAFLFYHSADCPEWISNTLNSHTDHRLVATGQNPLEILNFAKPCFEHCQIRVSLHGTHVLNVLQSLVVSSALLCLDHLLIWPLKACDFGTPGRLLQRLLPRSTFLSCPEASMPLLLPSSFYNQQQEGKSHSPLNVRNKNIPIP